MVLWNLIGWRPTLDTEGGVDGAWWGQVVGAVSLGVASFSVTLEIHHEIDCSRGEGWMWSCVDDGQFLSSTAGERILRCLK